MDVEELKQTRQFLYDLKNRCTDIMRWKDKHDPEGLIWKQSYIRYGILDEDFCIGEGSVTFTIHETWAYGGSEYHSYEIPFSEIISDSWHDNFLSQVEEKRTRKESDKIEKERLLHEQELAEYKRLKEKFGN